MVYVYITCKANIELTSNDTWKILDNLPKSNMKMPLQIVADTTSGGVTGGINCAISEDGNITIGTASKSIINNAPITIIGSYYKAD